MRTEHDSLQEEHSAATSELELCKGFLKDDKVLPLPSSYKFLEDVHGADHHDAAQQNIKTHLDNTLYLSSLWSDLSCDAELVIADSKLVQLYACYMEL